MEKTSCEEGSLICEPGKFGLSLLHHHVPCNYSRFPGTDVQQRVVVYEKQGLATMSSAAPCSDLSGPRSCGCAAATPKPVFGSRSSIPARCSSP